uniref:Uncharacterized protein n=1 Tax=Erpetoichthys calabaricus TaxID=27687 RepID=A0A8C4T8V6_ERPCA
MDQPSHEERGRGHRIECGRGPAHQQFTKQPTMAHARQQFNESRRFEEDHIPS